MRVAYCGNFLPSHSTENHVRIALEHNGHTVVKYQEGDSTAHSTLKKALKNHDLIMWTRTGALAARTGAHEQIRLIEAAQRAGVPIISYHLDRWWGLNRQHEIYDEPFFKTDLVISPDGAHDDMWVKAGVEHVWMNPGVTLTETAPGKRRQEYVSDIAFVGSYSRYHTEWTHRTDLAFHLRRWFRNRVAFWPLEGHPAIRGRDLQDLYASTKVVVGDSCLAPGYGGRPMTRYTSDRVPETIGRGGFLLHPSVKGVTDGTHYQPGVHLETWEAQSWGDLRNLINRSLDNPEHRKLVSEAGRQHVLANHTYEVRMEQVLELLKTRGMI